MTLGAGEDPTASARLRRPVVTGAFVLLIAVGLLTFRHYGVSWDEPDYYRYGEMTRHFYATGDRSFEGLVWRAYGPAVPLLHALVVDLAGVSTRSAPSLHHLVNFLIFVLGVGALYRLLLIQTRRWEWALFGAALLVLSPRIFSHAFVNPKDGPFLALFTISMYLLVRYLEERRPVVLAALGVTTALLFDVRVVGILVVGFTIGAMALDTMSASRATRLKELLRPTWLYLAVLVPVALALWPYLWPDPLGRLQESFSLMKHFTAGPSHVFFLGRESRVTDLPWHYLPVWLVVTTPLPYLLLAVVGILRTVGRGATHHYRSRSLARHYNLYAAWLLVPTAVTIVGRTPLYDEWRHVNFVYPALIIFAVAGAQTIHEWLRVRVWRGGAAAFPVLLGVLLAGVGITMIRLHPYEAVYFNRLAGGGARAQTQYELDYWGLSYREGLELLLAEHPGQTLRVHACTAPGEHNAAALADGARLVFVDDVDDADYAICAPRGDVPGVVPGAEYRPEARTVFTVERDGATLLYVKDLR